MAPAVIAAVAALASAAGQGYGAYLGGQASDAAAAESKRRWIADQQNQEEAMRFNKDQARINNSRADRQEVYNQPASSLNMLSGLSGLMQSAGRSTPADYLSILAGR